MNNARRRYDRFDTIEELLAPILVEDAERKLEMHKMCITGDLQVCDYNRGVVNVEVRAGMYPDDGNDIQPMCRLFVATSDDGGMGGWTLPQKSIEDAKDIAYEIMDVFRGYTVLPTREDINKKLLPLGICLDHE